MAQLLGKVRLRANGKELLTLAGSTLKTGGVKRSPVVGANGVHGFSEEIVAPMISCKISQTSDVDVTFIDSIKDATGIWQGDDGVNYSLTGMYCLGESELTEKGGEISTGFSAMSCVRI